MDLTARMGPAESGRFADHAADRPRTEEGAASPGDRRGSTRDGGAAPDFRGDGSATPAGRGASPIRGDSPSRRAADLAIALPALVLLSPVLALLAIAVKLESKGPAVYKQERVGKEGRPFRILKFRSMVADADRTGPQVAGRRDARITGVGKFLRAFKLDELPQLVNIVKGEMTLFGPRPEVPRYLPYFTDEERETLLVRPGLTGAGQMSYGADKEEELDRAADPEAHYIEHQLHAKLAADLDYLRRRSAGLDLALLWQTAVRTLLRKSVQGERA